MAKRRIKSHLQTSLSPFFAASLIDLVTLSSSRLMPLIWRSRESPSFRSFLFPSYKGKGQWKKPHFDASVVRISPGPGPSDRRLCSCQTDPCWSGRPKEQWLKILIHFLMSLASRESFLYQCYCRPTLDSLPSVSAWEIKIRLLRQGKQELKEYRWRESTSIHSAIHMLLK